MKKTVLEKKKGKEKKLALLPSLYERRHYLVIKGKTKVGDEKKIKESISNSVLRFVGVLGYAKAGPMFVEIEKDYCILSVTTKAVQQVKAALALSDFSCVGVSGTIKKARRFLS